MHQKERQNAIPNASIVAQCAIKIYFLILFRFLFDAKCYIMREIAAKSNVHAIKEQENVRRDNHEYYQQYLPRRMVL